MSTTPILSVEGLTKRFAVDNDQELTAVNRVSFEIHPATTLALVGESGSGKTTVGRCILRVLDPSEGTITFESTEISSLSPRRLRPLRRKLQAVFQDPTDSLDPRMRVAALVTEPLTVNSRLSEKERRGKAIEFLELVGLGEPTLRLFPHNLTAGEQQRVAIARALILEPSMLVLDEPTSSLDPIAREEILALLRKLQGELGTSFLFISHDLVSVRHISHRIAVMYLGEIVEEGPVNEVFEDPRHPYTQALLAAAPSVERSQQEDRLMLSGEIPSPIDLPKGCFLASRCPFAIEDCFESHPPLVTHEARSARCIRLGDRLQDRPVLTRPSKPEPGAIAPGQPISEE